MSALAVSYTLSRAARERLFAETGAFPDEHQHVKIDVSDIAPPERARWAGFLDHAGVLHLKQLVWESDGRSADYEAWPLEALVTTSAELRTHVQSMLDNREAYRAARLRTAQANIDEHIQEYLYLAQPDPERYLISNEYIFADLEWARSQGVSLEAYAQARATYEAAEQRRRRQEEEKEWAEKKRAQAEREARAQERAVWIQAHGSTYLKRAVRGGYDASRLYWDERAALTHPGYRYDHNQKAEWRSRSLPTLAALDEVDRVEAEHVGCRARVVWLTEPTEGGEQPARWAPAEAILLQDPDFDQVLLKCLPQPAGNQGGEADGSPAGQTSTRGSRRTRTMGKKG